MDEQPMTSERADELERAASSEEERTEIETLWMLHLNKQYGEQLTPDQLLVVHGESFRRGHGSGRREVEHEFSELADFARDLLSVS